MQRMHAVIGMISILLLIIGGCNTSDTLDTTYLQDIPSAPPSQTAPSTATFPDPPAPAAQTTRSVNQTVNQPVRQPTATPQVASSNLASPPTPAPGQTTTASLQTQSIQTSISFTPVIGAPVEAVQPLSRQLGTEARARGIVILQSGDAQSTHILKGYFSAFSDGNATTVGYVWDVLDTSGTRLHRIRGQETATGTAQDPWDVVQQETMEAIAARTIADYIAWRSSAGG